MLLEELLPILAILVFLAKTDMLETDKVSIEPMQNGSYRALKNGRDEEEESKDPQSWALLVAGSKGWQNYDDQANVGHAFNLLLAHGVKKGNIITMLYNDIANNARNPDKGIIINEPEGENVYEGLEIDYQSEDVTADNFLSVLQGEETNATARVIKSEYPDTIFVYFSGQGVPGALNFPESILYANKLNDALMKMFANNTFAKMVLYIDASYSGSMFENILPKDNNILAVTAAAPWETAYQCYKDKRLGVSLGSHFSINWMHDTEARKYPTASLLRDQILYVASQTKTSTVSKYGDLRIEENLLTDLMGNKKAKWKKFRPCTSSTESFYNREAKQVGETQQHTEHVKMPDIPDNEQLGNLSITKILLLVAKKDKDLIQQYSNKNYHLNIKNVECYEGCVRHFDKECMKISENPYLGKYLHVFINMCSSDKTDPERIRHAIDQVCSGNRGYKE